MLERKPIDPGADQRDAGRNDPADLEGAGVPTSLRAARCRAPVSVEARPGGVGLANP
jgi:hypothetical protein